MSEATREEFYQRLDDAPYAVKGFFETIEARFGQRNSVLVHFTHAHGIDMRIAIPREMTNTGQIRNFATMYWQVRNRVIHSRIFLTPEELANLGFSGAEEPKSSTEPLNAELRLSEDFWRYKAEDFGRYLEAAHIKMLAQC
ncbi:hypothetical protein KBY23_10990 [Ruegeria pomeroyi]|nr:hypothetical protein [Ruegeria pomeroyi]